MSPRLQLGNLALCNILVHLGVGAMKVGAGGNMAMRNGSMAGHAGAHANNKNNIAKFSFLQKNGLCSKYRRNGLCTKTVN